MEIEVLLELIELILKGEVGDFVENIIKKKFILDEEGLLVATQMRQIEFVRFVLNNGVKPTLESFQYAAEHEFFELCHLFVEFGSREILSTPELEDKLMFSIVGNNFSAVKKLVDRGVDLDFYDNYNIKLALLKGYTEIVDLLLNHGANPADNRWQDY